MRYFYRNGYYTPKHCKYGPRREEGVIINPQEWDRINYHMIKWEDEKNFAEGLRANEQNKKEYSYNMTKKWENTLASVKTQGENRRLEKIEKNKQDKINQYHEILLKREEERKKVLEEAKKVFYADKDTTKTIASSLLHSAVLYERSKQIEFKESLNKIQEEREKQDVEKIKKDLELFKKENEAEEVSKRKKLEKYKKDLNQQLSMSKGVNDVKKRYDQSKEVELQKKDILNMQKEMEEIKECQKGEKEKRRRFSQSFIYKSPKELALEQELKLEEEEETELNKIYSEYAKRFDKGRKLKEKERVDKSIKNREKATGKIAELIAASKRDQFELKATEKEEEELRRLKEEKERKQKLIAQVKEEQKLAQQKAEHDALVQKEINKWEIMQRYKREEINKEWREAEKMRKRAEKEDVRKNYILQWKEKEERSEKDKKEMEKFEVDESANREELLKYCDYAIEYAKRDNWPVYPVVAAVTKIKKENNLMEKSEIPRNMGKKLGEDGKGCNRKPMETPMSACYCFKC